MRAFCNHDNELSSSINGGALVDGFNAWPFAEKFCCVEFNSIDV